MTRELTYLQGQHAWRFQYATPAPARDVGPVCVRSRACVAYVKSMFTVVTNTTIAMPKHCSHCQNRYYFPRNRLRWLHPISKRHTYSCQRDHTKTFWIPLLIMVELNLRSGMRPGYPRSRDESNRSGVGKHFKSNTIGNHGDRLFCSICAHLPDLNRVRWKSPGRPGRIPDRKLNSTNDVTKYTWRHSDIRTFSAATERSTISRQIALDWEKNTKWM